MRPIGAETWKEESENEERKVEGLSKAKEGQIGRRYETGGMVLKRT